MGAERGVVLSTRGPEGKNLFLAAALPAGGDVDGLISEMLAVAAEHGGSTHPEEWCAWALSREPSEALVREFEARLGTADGVITHESVLYLIVDAWHAQAPVFPVVGEA